MGFTYPYLLSPGGMALPGFLKSSSGSRRSSSAISPRELPFPPSAKPPVGTSSGVSGRSPGMSLVASATGISPSKSTPSLSPSDCCSKSTPPTSSSWTPPGRKQLQARTDDTTANPRKSEHTPVCQIQPVSYTHLRAHETKANLVCRLLLEK